MSLFLNRICIILIYIQFHYYRSEPLPGVEKITAKMNVWDTGGQEKYGTLRKMYYQEASGCLVVYDVTDPESFEHIPKWIDELYENLGKIPVLLVGNKIDLERAQARDQAEAFAKSIQARYLETSALSGEGVSALFEVLAKLSLGV